MEDSSTNPNNLFKPEYAALGLRDPGPIPLPPSPESGESFVIIKTADELSGLDEDCSFTDVSLIQENKRILMDELAEIEAALKADQQPSQNTPDSPKGPEACVLEKTENTSESVASFKSVNNSLPSENQQKSGSNSYDMCTSNLPAMPKPNLEPDKDDSKAISILSFAPSDFGSEEILQAKITQLIDENTHLKDTLIQNNQSLKSHYERIILWQRDVERVHEGHKEKFKEAKKCIETLKEENNALKQQIETSQKEIKTAQLESANKKIMDLEESLEKLSLQKDECLAEGAREVEMLREKLERYEKELENAYKKIRGLEKSMEEHSDVDSERLKLIEEKLLLSEMSNERANKEILSLRNQLAQTVQMTDETSKLQLALKRLEAELESRNSSIMFAQNRIIKLEGDLEAALNKTKELEANVEFIKEKEEQANIAAWQARHKYAELEHANQYLRNTQQETNHRNPENDASELAYAHQQLRQSQKALTDCEQNKTVAQSMVAKLSGHLADLQRQLETNRRSAEDNEFALRTQLDIYKADFEAEREAKESTKQEKDKLTEDLQHLHRRNQQMQEEIELLREQVRQHGGRPRHSAREEPQASPILQRYPCPICQVQFRSVKMVQDHLDTCVCHAPW
ncbi:optineurin-like isoform X2 [Anthonomus grandis grandis]|uniref:optineurin-like isoform X2 n=2 Tax=Anthonomus grandis grandis TaxID=2921223 RepID=UPI002165239B|nr:optineurin-like isoform X2 [Anthonomus grandis grandis]